MARKVIFGADIHLDAFKSCKSLEALSKATAEIFSHLGEKAEEANQELWDAMHPKKQKDPDAKTDPE